MQADLELGEPVAARHTFEISGLGKAPFKVVQPKQHAIEAGATFFCEHCGTVIKNRHFIKSADGKVSVVGVDCLKKTGDAGLVQGVKRLAREQRAQAREAERMAKKEVRIAKERTENGGKSNSELAADLERQYEAMTTVMIEAVTSHPLHDMLTKFGFEQSMQHAFYLLEPYTKGQLNTLYQIVAKKQSGARKGSAAYKAAYPQAVELVDGAQALLESKAEERAKTKARIALLRLG